VGVSPISPPRLHFRLVECRQSLWRHFRRHHYKSQQLSTKSRCFVLVALPSLSDVVNFVGAQDERRLLAKGALVGFVATVDHFGWKGPCGTPKTPARRAHRTVVLPSFQGLGIGSCLSDACAELHRREGFLYFGQTVHPRFGRYRDRSPLWKATPWNHRTSTHRVETWKQRLGNVRIKRRNAKFVYSHQYVGEDPEKSGDACSGHARRVVVLKEGEAGPLWHTRTHPP